MATNGKDLKAFLGIKKVVKQTKTTNQKLTRSNEILQGIKQVVEKYLEENVQEYKSVTASGFARASKDSDEWTEKVYNGKYIVLESSLENENGEIHKGFRLLDIKHYFENGNSKSEKGFVVDFKEI